MTKALSNVLTWRLIDPDPALSDPAALSELLAQHPLENPSAVSQERTGWIKPLGHQGHGHAIPLWENSGSLISLGVAKRVLSKKVVSQLVQAKVAEIEKAEDRKVFAQEKSRIKAEILDVKLPKADIEYSCLYAFVSPPYLMVLTGSVKTAEKLIDDLRASLKHGLKAIPVSGKELPIHAYTRWVTEGTVDPTTGWTLGTKFTVYAKAEGTEKLKGAWFFTQDNMLSDWLASGGKKITEIELNYESQLGETTFITNEMLGFKGIKWPSDLVTQASAHQGDQWGEDEADDVLTTMNLGHSALRDLLASFLDLLGGEKLPVVANQDDLPGEEDGDLI